jgi:hypothetical protein
MVLFCHPCQDIRSLTAAQCAVGDEIDPDGRRRMLGVCYVCGSLVRSGPIDRNLAFVLIAGGETRSIAAELTEFRKQIEEAGARLVDAVRHSSP